MAKREFNKETGKATGTDDIKDYEMLAKLRPLPKYNMRYLETDDDGQPLAMQRMKDFRNRLLNVSDWTQAADSQLSDSDKAAWKTYRQALRDLTSTANPKLVDCPGSPRHGGLDFSSFTWPTAPTGDIL